MPIINVFCQNYHSLLSYSTEPTQILMIQNHNDYVIILCLDLAGLQDEYRFKTFSMQNVGGEKKRLHNILYNLKYNK